MRTYEEMAKGRYSMGETGDCGVIALAIATDLSYDECHYALKRAGRKNRGATYVSQLRAAAKELGFEFKEVSFLRRENVRHALYRRGYGVKNLTLRQIQMFPEEFAEWGDRVIVHTSWHFSGMRFQEVVDWAASKAKHVKRAYQLVKIDENEIKD